MLSRLYSFFEPLLNESEPTGIQTPSRAQSFILNDEDVENLLNNKPIRDLSRSETVNVLMPLTEYLLDKLADAKKSPEALESISRETRSASYETVSFDGSYPTDFSHILNETLAQACFEQPSHKADLTWSAYNLILSGANTKTASSYRKSA